MATEESTQWKRHNGRVWGYCMIAGTLAVLFGMGVGQTSGFYAMPRQVPSSPMSSHEFLPLFLRHCEMKKLTILHLDTITTLACIIRQQASRCLRRPRSLPLVVRLWALLLSAPPSPAQSARALVANGVSYSLLSRTSLAFPSLSVH